VLCALDLAGIAAFARQLVEQTFHGVKLSTLGIPMSRSYRIDMYPGPVSGPNPPVAARIRQVFGKYDKKIYQYYTSHTQSEAASEGANEKGMDARANIFKKPFFVMMPFLVVAIIGGVWWKGGYLLDKYRKKPDAPVTAPASGATGAVPAQRPSPSLLGSALATAEGAGTWRVVGTIENLGSPERSYAMLSDGKGPHVKVPLNRCEVTKDEPTRCKYDGFWYSESGRAEVATVANEPLKIWSGAPSADAAEKARAKVAESTHGEVASIVEGADELVKLSQSRVGLDDPHRPALTMQSVAARR
jgi:zona occludens toxin (predicted ATPase)